MRRRLACINDLPIKEADRKFFWPLGARPAEHPGLCDRNFDDRRLRGPLHEDTDVCRDGNYRKGRRLCCPDPIGSGPAGACRGSRHAQGRSWAEKGCEVAIASIDDVDGMTKAFSGVDGVFLHDATRR